MYEHEKQWVQRTNQIRQDPDQIQSQVSQKSRPRWALNKGCRTYFT